MIVQMNRPGSGVTSGLFTSAILSSAEDDAPFSTINRQKTSARIATPSSRNNGRLVAPLICPAALG